jgi:hypothetical protein
VLHCHSDPRLDDLLGIVSARLKRRTVCSRATNPKRLMILVDPIVGPYSVGRRQFIFPKAQPFVDFPSSYLSAIRSAMKADDRESKHLGLMVNLNAKSSLTTRAIGGDADTWHRLSAHKPAAPLVRMHLGCIGYPMAN